MAIEAIMLDLFRQIRANFSGRRIRILSAGYPDLLVNEATVERLFGVDICSKLRFREDGDKIAKWHGLQGKLQRVIDAQHFFDLLGCDLDVLDVASTRGNEIISDLNYPIDRNIFGEYEIVVDSGTCEHVFNAGQAVINLASLVRQDGFIVQAAPLNGYNHGFYNFSPTIFYDFYSEQSGYRLVFLKGFSNLVRAPVQFDVLPTQRFNNAPENSVLMAVAQRIAMRELKPVIQHKYKGMIE